MKPRAFSLDGFVGNKGRVVHEGLVNLGRLRAMVMWRCLIPALGAALARSNARRRGLLYEN